MIGEISIPELTGKPGIERRKVSVCFSSKNKKRRQIAHESKGLVKELEVRICKKYTLPEHIVKIGHVIGPCVRLANLKRHKVLKKS